MRSLDMGKESNVYTFPLVSLKYVGKETTTLWTVTEGISLKVRAGAYFNTEETLIYLKIEYPHFMILSKCVVVDY